jgi:hypothetical protein
MTITLDGTTGITTPTTSTTGEFVTSVTGFKNRLINGSMVIDQRNAGASVSIQTSTGYVLDRWNSIASVNSKFSIQQNAGSITPPVGFSNYMGLTSSATTSLGAGDYYGVRQFIEGFNVADLAWGTANAKSVTLSFWVYSSLTGTFGGVFYNNAFNRSYPFTYTISSANTWEQKFITVSGDTTGTWLTNNSIGIAINFSIGTGSTYSGTANSWSANSYLSATGATSVVGTNGATFYITGVQLEKGSTATSFDYRSYGTELALCQRYYETYSNGTGTGSISEGLTAAFPTTGICRGFVPFKVTKRASPTVTVPTTYITINSTVGNTSPSAGGSSFASSEGASINFTVSAVVAGQACTVGISSSAPITISAEL